MYHCNETNIIEKFSSSAVTWGVHKFELGKDVLAWSDNHLFFY